MKKICLIICLQIAFGAISQDSDSLSINDNLFWNSSGFYNPAHTGINGNRIGFSSSFANIGSKISVSKFFKTELVTKNKKHAFGYGSYSFSSDNLINNVQNISYARRFNLRNGNLLSFGTQLGIYHEHRPFYNAESNTIMDSNLTLGVSYKTKNLRIGLSGYVPRFDFRENSLKKYNYNARLEFAYNFRVGRNVNIIPSLSFGHEISEYSGRSFMTGSSKIDFIYKKKLFLTLGHDPLRQRSGMELGYMISDRLKLSFSTSLKSSRNNSNFGFGISFRF